MKRLITMLASVVIAIALSPTGSAEKHGGGKHATTGLEHKDKDKDKDKSKKHKGKNKDKDKDKDKDKH